MCRAEKGIIICGEENNSDLYQDCEIYVDVLIISLDCDYKYKENFPDISG